MIDKESLPSFRDRCGQPADLHTSRNIDLQKLRVIALAASQGQWYARPASANSAASVSAETNGSMWPILISSVVHPHHAEDMAHIAAFSPGPVLELLDEIERLRAIVDAPGVGSLVVLDHDPGDEADPR